MYAMMNGPLILVMTGLSTANTQNINTYLNMRVAAALLTNENGPPVPHSRSDWIENAVLRVACKDRRPTLISKQSKYRRLLARQLERTGWSTSWELDPAKKAYLCVYRCSDGIRTLLSRHTYSKRSGWSKHVPRSWPRIYSDVRQKILLRLLRNLIL
jgi:hypothetical protein